MAVAAQVITDRYAIYNSDCVEVLQTLPKESIHLSVYSPPFAGLYHYSSSERDMSNCRSYEEFMEHYTFCVRELTRVTKPGRITAVHCTDVPSGNTGRDHMRDFPGDIIRQHEAQVLRMFLTSWSISGSRIRLTGTGQFTGRAEVTHGQSVSKRQKSGTRRSEAIKTSIIDSTSFVLGD
jgi:hypothetical protein